VSASTAEQVCKALTHDPQTPLEIARIVKRDQKIVQTVLLELSQTHPDEVVFKKIGRYRLFWKPCKTDHKEPHLNLKRRKR
jgi:hypothetical protein